jgi:hypothetical protein
VRVGPGSEEAGVGTRKTIGSLVVGLALFLGAASVEGGDEQRFLSALEECQKAVRARRYTTALGLYEKLLQAHEGRDYVRRRAAAIEDDLRICHFHRSYREPSVESLLGPALKEYRRQRRRVVLEYGDEGSPEVARDWKKQGELSFLDHVFEGDLDIRHPATPAVLFHFNPQEGSGYAVLYVKQKAWQSPSTSTLAYEDLALALYRLDAGDRTLLDQDQFRLTRFGTDLGNKVHCEGKDLSASARRGAQAYVSEFGESRYRTGRIAIAGSGAGVRIEGQLEKGYLTQLSREAESRAYQMWCAASYDRNQALPAWLREEAKAESRPLRLPSDAPAARGEEIRSLLQAWYDDETDDLAEAVRKLEETAPLPPRTKGYLGALAELHAGEVRKALAAVTALLEAEEGFGPAHALRGFLRLRLREEEAPGEDLARAKELAPDDPLTVLLEVTAAQVDRNIERADEVLAEALQRGVRTKAIEARAHAIHRSRYGPAWTRRFRMETHHFVVESDHSYDASRDVAARLSLACDAYRKHFPGRPPSERKSRVRVFSNQADYVAYGRELGTDLGPSAGVYLSLVRELVLFYRAGEKETFDRTVRHEGFHWYVHELADDLPIWFNEGHAMCFETAPREGAPPDPTLVNSLRVLELRALRTQRKRLPVVGARELMLMDAGTFMRDPTCNYPHAWALVHLLRTTDDPALARTLDAYFDAVRRGLSREEAFEEVYAGSVDALERAYEAHVIGLVDR